MHATQSMSTSLSTICLILVILRGSVCSANSSTNWLEGLTYYPGAEKLSGKLVFLVHHDFKLETNSETKASIYEFNLAEERLNKLTDCPNGQFVPSLDGGTYAVIYWRGVWDIGKATNVFVYS